MNSMADLITFRVRERQAFLFSMKSKCKEEFPSVKLVPVQFCRSHRSPGRGLAEVARSQQNEPGNFSTVENEK
jgi:hypothetical protein